MRIILAILLALIAYAPAYADTIVYYRTALTGGAAGALDAQSGTPLVDGDMAFVAAGGYFYHYILDADSGAAESSPSVISPDSNAGSKRWILQDVSGGFASDVQAILAAANNAAIKVLLSLTPGTDVQAYHALLADIAGLSLTVGDMIYFDGTNFVKIDSGTANYVMMANGAAAPTWSGTLQTSAIDLTTGTFNAKMAEVIKTASAVLTAKETAHTVITNYGETDDADLILTGPDIDGLPGHNFTYAIVATMSVNDTCFKAAADNLIRLDATNGADNGCVCNADPTAGHKLVCISVTTGAGAGDWDCESYRGTWSIVADNTGDCPD